MQFEKETMICVMDKNDSIDSIHNFLLDFKTFISSTRKIM